MTIIICIILPAEILKVKTLRKLCENTKEILRCWYSVLAFIFYMYFYVIIYKILYWNTGWARNSQKLAENEILEKYFTDLSGKSAKMNEKRIFNFYYLQVGRIFTENGRFLFNLKKFLMDWAEFCEKLAIFYRIFLRNERNFFEFRAIFYRIFRISGGFYRILIIF